MVQDTQNNLYYFIISISKENKSTQVTAKIEIVARCKRKPLHGMLAFEWVSFSLNIYQRITLIEITKLRLLK